MNSFLLNFFCKLSDKSVVDDSTLREFLAALSPLDSAEIVRIAERSGHRYISERDVESFFEELKNAGLSAREFGAGMLKQRLENAEKRSFRGRMKGLSGGVLAFLVQLIPYAVLGVVGAGLSLVLATVNFVHWGVLLRFAGIALAATGGVAFLIWGFCALLVSGGNAIDPTHEWRYVNRGGSPGGRFRAGTRRDLYDHIHGSGSWARRDARVMKVCKILCAIAVPVCPLICFPYLQQNGVKDIETYIGCYLVYPVMPAILVIAIVAGLAYWYKKTVLIPGH
jgi:hypothetical protein